MTNIHELSRAKEKLMHQLADDSVSIVETLVSQQIQQSNGELKSNLCQQLGIMKSQLHAAEMREKILERTYEEQLLLGLRLDFDCHTHTTYSDGVWSPEQLVIEAKKRGIIRLAVTDHNTTAGIEMAVKKADELGIMLIPGIELDCAVTIDNTVLGAVEVIGYGVSESRERFVSEMRDFAKAKRNTKMQIIRRVIGNLSRVYTENSVEKQNLLARSQKDAVWKAISAMCSEEEFDSFYYDGLFDLNPEIGWYRIGLVSFMNDAMRKTMTFYDERETEPVLAVVAKTETVAVRWMVEHLMLHRKKLAAINPRVLSTAIKRAHTNLFPTADERIQIEKEENHLTPDYKAVIAKIREAGGIPVLAHPAAIKGIETMWFSHTSNKYREGINPEVIVQELARAGLKGVELYYYIVQNFKPGECIKANNYFAALAEKYHLCLTYGSDCHGPVFGNAENISLGRAAISQEVLYAVRKRGCF